MTVSVHRRTRHDPRDHKLLIVCAALAVAYCLAVPFAANLLGHLGF
ncbi:MAG TPA: hypothetical protein VLC74_08875 [Rhizomicrobium sp.]|jgi:hypothetical protein|nr:hypothetical protein [Rhizomicrobium sp.]